MFGMIETFTLDNVDVLLSYLNDENIERYPLAPAVLTSILQYPMNFKGSLDALKVGYNLSQMTYLVDMAYKDADYYKTNGQRETFGLYLNPTRYQEAINFFDYLSQFIKSNNNVLQSVIVDMARYMPNNAEVQSIAQQAAPTQTQALVADSQSGTSTTTTDGEPKKPFPIGWVIGGAALLAVIITVIVIAKKRR